MLTLLGYLGPRKVACTPSLTLSCLCCPVACLPACLCARLQVAVDFSETRHAWVDMIRVWAIHMSHDKYDRALQSSQVLATIIASHRRSQQVRQRLKLRPITRGLAAEVRAG